MARNALTNLVRWAKRRAKEQDVPFNLTEDDLIIPTICPVLGIPLFHSEGSSSDNSPTVDRIIPDVGYVPGNVVVVSSRANRLKSDASLEELRRVIDYYEHFIINEWMQPIAVH
jgi:hypothetical protein